MKIPSWINEFITAVYPEASALALASFNEEMCIKEATRRILDLSAQLEVARMKADQPGLTIPMIDASRTSQHERIVAELLRMLDEIYDLPGFGPHETTIKTIHAVADRIVSLLPETVAPTPEPAAAPTREEIIEECANVRPSRRMMKHPPGDWYVCGWNDAVVAMDEAIRALKERAAPSRIAGEGSED
ncbi:MAG: hypothetical protein ACRD52_00800 [Candidatus Acidiferrales bacterium]